MREELYGTAEPADLHRQEGRAGQLAVPGQGRARSERHRHLHRRAAAALRRERGARRARGAPERCAERARRDAGRSRPRTPYFCSGCPHNSSTKVPEGMRAYAGIGCHYMAQWMDREHAGLHPDGRRGRELDRRGAVLQAQPRVPESRRRHLQPLGLPGDPRLGRLGRQHHLQDPVQRRGGDDRRPAQRRRPDGADDRPPGRRRRREAHRRRHRRAGEVSARREVAVRADHPSPRRPDAGAGELADDRRRHRADLRPDLRGREAPPAQARRLSRSGQARRHQRTRLRGLRRLRRAVELRVGPAGRDRVRPQAPDRPVELQQGLSPASRASARPSSPCEGAKLKQGQGVAERWRFARRPAGAADRGAADRPAPTRSSSPASAAPASSPSAPCSAWRRISKARAAASSTWPASRRRAARCISHIRIAERSEDIHAIRVAAASADLVLGGDLVVAGAKKVLAAIKPGHGGGDQSGRDPARRFHPQRRLLAADRAAQARHRGRRGRASTAHFIDATRLATALLGNSIATNIFLVGYAYQLGALPLSAAAIEQAIELNGEAVAMNQAAFRWGRRAAADLGDDRKAGPAATAAVRRAWRRRSTRWSSAASRS